MYKAVKGHIILDADIIGSVPIFEAIWNSDTTTDKVLAKAKMRMIFHMCNPNSPYATAAVYNKLTKIAMDLYSEDAIVMEWFRKHYIPVKIAGNKIDKRKRKPKAGEDDADDVEFEALEVIHTDKQFERAISIYKNFLNLIPQYAMLQAAQTAVHNLSERIASPNTPNPETLLKAMNAALRDLKDMEELIKLEEDKAITTRGGHSVRKREDPSYLLDKYSIKK